MSLGKTKSVQLLVEHVKMPSLVNLRYLLIVSISLVSISSLSPLVSISSIFSLVSISPLYLSLFRSPLYFTLYPSPLSIYPTSPPCLNISSPSLLVSISTVSSLSLYPASPSCLSDLPLCLSSGSKPGIHT